MIFGIDGGGTSTRIRICNEQGQELSYQKGKSSNIYSVGEEAALDNLKTLIQAACSQANLPIHALTSGCIGSAGLQRAYERELFQSFFEQLLPSAAVRLCTDAEIMLVGGLNDLEGYSLTCGTGSIAMGRSREGKLIRAGGLGYMLGDEGSALWIAYEAIKRSLRSIEHRDLPTGMLPQLLHHFGLKESSDFIHLMHNEFDKSSIAAACSLVFDAMHAGDVLAQDIIKTAIRELVKLVQSVMLSLPLGDARLVLGGGIFENNMYFFDAFAEALQRIEGAPEAIRPLRSAEYGALLLAQQQG